MLKRKICAVSAALALIIAFTAYGITPEPAEAEKNSSVPADFTSVISDGTKALYFNTESGALLIKDSSTGNEWRSTPLNYDADENIKNSIKMNYDSQLIIKYSDKSGNIYELSSKNYCVNKGGLTYSNINGGIRANYYFEKCGVMIPVDYTLAGDIFSASIAIDEIKEENENYKLVGWSLLPYFNAGGTSDEGFLFVPDGCGAIINFNNGKSAYKTYKQYIYGRDTAIDVTAASGHTENAMLPVFGTSAPEGSSLAVISSGESRCAVNAQVSGATESFNSVYCEFIYRDNTMASFNDKSWNKKEVRVFEDNPPALEKFTVEYILMEPDAGYTDMALAFQDYLVECGILKDSAEDNYYPLYINLFGSVNAVKHVLGFPVNSEIALTKYSDAVDILETMLENGTDDIILKYNNWIKGGPESSIPVSPGVSTVLGGKAEFSKLCEFIEKNGIDGYFDLNMTDMYKSRIGYIKSIDSAKMLNESPVIQYQYSLSTLQKKENDVFWYLLNPAKVYKASSKAAERLKKLEIPGISCDTLSQKLYSSYNRDGMDRVSAQNYWINALEELKASTGKMLCAAPMGYVLGYADAVSSLPTQSSCFAITDADVPFYQIVLHGKITYSMEANNKFADYDKSILTALETGSCLQFEWIADNSDKTDGTQYYTLYSAEYEKWIEKAEDTYREISPLMKKISSAAITEHRELQDGVRHTGYENGISVTVNYNDYDVQTEFGKVPAMGYTVTGE